MQHHRVGFRHRKHFIVDLVGLKHLFAFFRLAFLSHGRPDVGVEDVGVLRHFENVGGAGEPAALVCPFHDVGVGLVACGAGDGDFHAELDAAHDEGVGHIVAVADVAEFAPLDVALILADGHEVGEHLAGVAIVREPVDDGDGAELGEGFHFPLIEGADHDAVEVAREHAGGVLDDLSPADLQVAGGEEEGCAAEVEHAHLE